MNGIILAYKSQLNRHLKKDDIVTIGNGDGFYSIDKIEDNYISDFKYFVTSKINGKLMNFAKDELEYYQYGFFDSLKWFNDGIKVFLGFIHKDDIIHIKSKILVEKDLGFSDIDTISMCEILDEEFEGECIEINGSKYFKLIR